LSQRGGYCREHTVPFWLGHHPSKSVSFHTTTMTCHCLITQLSDRDGPRWGNHEDRPINARFVAREWPLSSLPYSGQNHAPLSPALFPAAPSSRAQTTDS